jgi:hypothetical protein
MSVDITKAFAVVFNSSDGSHIVCATPDEVSSAIAQVVFDGGVPNVFTRNGGTQQVNNRVSGPVHGSITMARDIHGGVRL